LSPSEFATPDARVFRPDITVATVAERDGRFLFVEERVRGALVLNQPAGHLEPDESVLDAAVRETLEESAWEVELTGLVAIYQWVEPVEQRPLIRFTFAARPLRERAGAALDTGIERALWLTEAEARSARFAPRSPFVLRSLDDYRARRPLPLDTLSALDLRAGATIVST
jgi:ADP-ribose pyrophosphatase YjhB (NUDIX family)